MSTCIRCGKSCADGSTLCPDCLAWYREKNNAAKKPASSARDTFAENMKKADEATRAAEAQKAAEAARAAEEKKSAEEKKAAAAADAAAEKERLAAEKKLAAAEKQRADDEQKKKDFRKKYRKVLLRVWLRRLLILALIAAVVFFVKSRKEKKAGKEAAAAQAAAEKAASEESKTYPEYGTGTALPEYGTGTALPDDNGAPNGFALECPTCGTLCTDPDARFCASCGGDLYAEPLPEPELHLAEKSEIDQLIVSAVPKPATSESSVVSQSGSHNNTAAVTVDGDTDTSWQEGVEGDGIGEWIAFRLDTTRNVRCIALNLGNWRSNDWYEQNNVPKTIDFEIAGETYTVTFPKEKTRFFVCFNRPVETDSVKMTVREVYNGSKYHDTCIAEVTIYEE